MSNYDSGPGRCISVHAEQNALLYSSRTDVEGATIYVTGRPCPTCARLISGSGIIRVVYSEGSAIVEYDPREFRD